MTHFPAAALFDLDGVLIDTETIYTQIWTDIEREHPTGIENFAIVIKGNTLQRILSTYFPDPEEQVEICSMLRTREEAMEYHPFDGVIDLLTDLQHHGVPAAIVTSSNAPKMERLFEQLPGFRELFDIVLTDSDVSRGKPDPECYLKAAERLGVDPTECIVFEDSFSGLKAGRAAGAHVVALATTNTRESLQGHADVIIDGFGGYDLRAICELL